MGDGCVKDEAVRTNKADGSSRAEISANLLGTFSRISETPTEYEKAMQLCVLGLNISLNFLIWLFHNRQSNSAQPMVGFPTTRVQGDRRFRDIGLTVCTPSLVSDQINDHTRYPAPASPVSCSSTLSTSGACRMSFPPKPNSSMKVHPS
jgi:hypothetical protein